MDARDLRQELRLLSDECIHCGLCLEACPTYALTGAEPDSPRGRIHLMKALVEGQLPADPGVFGPLDRCLGCRACETACPSSVKYGHLLESVRADFVAPTRSPRGAQAMWKLMLDHLLPYPRRLRLLLAPLTFTRKVAPWLLETVRPLMPALLRRQMDLVDGPGDHEAPLPEWTPAVGPSRGTVALLTGCVMAALYRSTNRAAVRMLARSGFDVWIPGDQGCCGALHVHDGDRDRAHAMMRTNLAAFGRKELSAVVVTSAGCGAAMKDYGHWVPETDPAHGSADAFARKVKDITEFLAEVGIPTPDRAIPLRAAYHEACHLGHGQKIRQAPRDLLAKIPGLTLVPLTESDWCCGGAGSYTLLQPENSEKLLARKMGHIADTGVELVVTGNPSCLMQLGLGIRREGGTRELLHTVELLDRAYADRRPAEE